MTPNLTRYERIAPFYDLLDLPFERKRYTALRPLMFRDLSGELPDAGIGTGRMLINFATGISSCTLSVPID